MDDKTREMVRGWLTAAGGDRERTARWIAYSMNLCGIRQARLLVNEAMMGDEAHAEALALEAEAALRRTAVR